MSSPMKLLSIFALLALLVVGCAPAAPAEEFVGYAAEEPAPPAPEAPAAALAESPADLPDESAEITDETFDLVNYNIGQQSERMIIKNGDIKLLVKDTEVAIDGVTQLVRDVGGYIISSRVWYEDWYGTGYKSASISVGVPVDQFETALRRLRGLSIRVLDEQATGEDVTDQFVDLESKLTNLEATRNRIRTFLDQAQTVEEALTINEELAKVEAEIEEVKGRMNYLAGRSAFSTILITLSPDLPAVTPTSTPVPTATFTPMPTATSTPWQPGETVREAGQTLTKSYQGIAEILIWLVLVFLPIVAPFVFVGWLLWRFFQKKK